MMDAVERDARQLTRKIKVPIKKVVVMRRKNISSDVLKPLYRLILLPTIPTQTMPRACRQESGIRQFDGCGHHKQQSPDTLNNDNKVVPETLLGVA